MAFNCPIWLVVPLWPPVAGMVVAPAVVVMPPAAVVTPPVTVTAPPEPVVTPPTAVVMPPASVVAPPELVVALGPDPLVQPAPTEKRAAKRQGQLFTVAAFPRKAHWQAAEGFVILSSGEGASRD